MQVFLHIVKSRSTVPIEPLLESQHIYSSLVGVQMAVSFALPVKRLPEILRGDVTLL